MVLLGKRKIRMPKIIDQINKNNSHLTKCFNIKSTCMNALKNIANRFWKKSCSTLPNSKITTLR